MKIAIIGAGVTGRLTALRLIPYGCDLTLLEAQSFDNPINATAISAGLIAPLSESIHTGPEAVRLGLKSQTLWPDILSQLHELDPHHRTVSYQSNGTLAISFPEEQECLLRHQAKLLETVPEHRESIKMLYNDEVMAIEPELARFETAVFIKGEGNICNTQFLEASNRAIRKNVAIVDHWALKGDGTELQKKYDWIIDCRGAGAVQAHTHAENGNNTLMSVRGEVIRVQTKNVHLSRPIRVIQQRFTIFIAPKPNNIYVVGATDLDKHGAHAVTVRSSLDLLSAIYSLHPGFADAEIIEAIAGQRALYKHRKPEVLVRDNIISINGLNRQGWMTAPALVEQILPIVI